MIRQSSTITSVAAALLVVVMLIPTSTQAQQPNPRLLQPLRDAAIAQALKAESGTGSAARLTTPAVQTPSNRRDRSVGRKVLGGLLGATAGFFAGGYLGAAIDGDCNCDDPGLKGAVIGAPIGAAIGGILGVKLF